MSTVGMLSALAVGQLAPDFRLKSHRGDEVSLSSYHGRKNVVLFFVRTYTCYSCREHVHHLVRLYNEFQKYDAEVLVILNADQQAAIGYADITRAPFPVLSDPDHSIYEQYGLHKVMLLSTRSGSVVVDKDGKISYLRALTNPWAWRTETQNLIEHLKSL